MTVSILNTMKEMLIGDSVIEDDDSFDTDIIVHINTALFVLNQLGVGPAKPFRITGTNETWSDFLGENERFFESAKTYIYLYVRSIFDTPSGAAKEEADKKSSELEWRMNVAYENEEVR